MESGIQRSTLQEAELTPIENLVSTFFKALEEAPIDWAVLRGSEGLPEFTRYDIDILIRPGDVEKAEELLGHAAKKENWSVYRIVDKFAYRCCLLISDGVNPRFLPIDFFSDCYHRFYKIADGAYALENRKMNDKGVAVAPAGFGSSLALLKELTRHDTFKEDSREEVRDGAINDPDSFVRGVENQLGENLTARLLKACQEDDWGSIEAAAFKIRKKITSSARWFSFEAFKFFLGNARHHLHPPMSAFVVLLGPDGAGKSTIADLVCKELYKKPFKVTNCYEQRFRAFPELKHFKRKILGLLGRGVPEQEKIEPGTKGSGMNKDHSTLRGMAYVSYYVFDFLTGHLTLRKLRGQGGLVIFSRYFYDYYFQLGYRKIPHAYLRFLENLVPKPDLVFYLDRDGKEIYEGKPELDIDEIMRQQNAIKKLISKRKNAHVIDASMGIEHTVQAVASQVIRGFLSSAKE